LALWYARRTRQQALGGLDAPTVSPWPPEPRSGSAAVGNGLQWEDQDTDLPELGIGGQGGVELAGQLDRVWFLDRAVCLDFAGVGVDE
jgi:hypothetical protein